MHYATFLFGFGACLILGWVLQIINYYNCFNYKKKKKYARILVKCWVFNNGAITFRDKSQINPKYAHTLHDLSTEAEFDVEVIDEVGGRLFVSSVDYIGDRTQKFPLKVGQYSMYQHIPRSNVVSFKELIFNKQGILTESNETNK